MRTLLATTAVTSIGKGGDQALVGVGRRCALPDRGFLYL